MSALSEYDKALLNSIFNPLSPIGELIISEDFIGNFEDNEEETPNIGKAKQIELEGVKAAEAGDWNKAEELFTNALEISTRASGYNNRAQILRLKGKDDDAMKDLDMAIKLSRRVGKVASLALCQRGLLHRKRGQEAEATEDFTQAAQLGSHFAKLQVVKMNPYAAMCNQMLSQMMTVTSNHK